MPLKTSHDLLGSLKSLLSGNAVAPISLHKSQIPYVVLIDIVKQSGVSKSDMKQLVHIDMRAIARRKSQLLTQKESEKLVRFCKLIDEAESVFGNQRLGVQWLTTSNLYLGSDTPISYVESDGDADSIANMLGRIAHGVFAYHLDQQ